MLARRCPFTLRRQHVKRANEPKPRLAWLDDVVEPSVACSNVGVAKLRLVLRDERLAYGFLLTFLGGSNFPTMDDVDCSFGPHDSQLSRRPRHVVIAGQVLARHGQIRAAVGLSGHERELRNGGLINSKRGKQGGYSLAKAPKEITLYDIVTVIDGELLGVSLDANGSSGESVQKVWMEVAEALKKKTMSYSLESFLPEESDHMYYI